jgi:hypothetical protein
MQNSSDFPESFLLLQQEGFLISTSLCTGLTALRSANLNNKGAFYSALFNLSVGFERLLKAIIIMEYMLNNGLQIPSKKQLKDFGHNIKDLHVSAVKIGESRQVSIVKINELNSIDESIVNLINEFALTSRYYNLDALTSSHIREDPLAIWGDIIFEILKQDVSEHQKLKIFGQAVGFGEAIDQHSITLIFGLDRKKLSTIEALALPGLHDQAVKYAVFRIINFLMPLKRLIEVLSDMSYTLNLPAPPYPFMQEFLQWLWDDRAYVLRKKRWP